VVSKSANLELTNMFLFVSVPSCWWPALFYC